MKIFNSVSDLQAASLTAGQLTSTKGYTTAGDGGGATYLIKTAVDYAGTPDEYGDHSLANGNVAVLQTEGSVNVKQFGAVGDGVADDTAAIEAACDLAKEVDLGDGVYRVDFLNNFNHVRSLIGDDARAKLIRHANASGINAGRKDDLILKNIEIDNQKSVNKFEGHGITTAGNNQTFENIKVVDYGSSGTGGGTGLLLSGPSESSNARVRNCYFQPNVADSAITLGWLADNYTTSFFDSIYAKDVQKGIGYAHELKNNSTFNVLSNLIAEKSNYALAYGQTTVGVDGADVNIASNILGKYCDSGVIIGEGYGNLVSNLLLDRSEALGIESSPKAIEFTGGAMRNSVYSANLLGSFDYTIDFDGADNYAEATIHNNPTSKHVRFTAGATGNVANLISLRGNTTILGHIEDNSGSGYKGEHANVVYSNAHGEQLGSKSGHFYWGLTNPSAAFLSSTTYRFEEEKYALLGLGTDGSTGNLAGIDFATPASANRGRFFFALGATAADDYYSLRMDGGNRYSFRYGSFTSLTDNAISLGEASSKWSVVYAGTGTISTSDDREKTYLDITKVEKEVALELKQNMRKFKWNDAIKAKGDDARIHFGTSAQTVKSIFEKHGLVAEDYGLFCYDEWEQKLDEEGNVITEAGNRYGIRYEELLCFIMSAI